MGRSLAVAGQAVMRVMAGVLVGLTVVLLIVVGGAQPASAGAAVAVDEGPDDAGVPFTFQQPSAPAPAQIPGGSGGAQQATLVTQAASAKVTGAVTYRERIALPTNAVVQVSLLDTSRLDASAITLGEQSITTGGAQVPIPFEIAYDPAAIDQRFTYSLRARITVDGQLLFTSTTATLVITRGNPTHVEIVLQRV